MCTCRVNTACIESKFQNFESLTIVNFCKNKYKITEISCSDREVVNMIFFGRFQNHYTSKSLFSHKLFKNDYKCIHRSHIDMYAVQRIYQNDIAKTKVYKLYKHKI